MGPSARLDIQLMIVNGLVKLVASAPTLLPLAFVSALVTSLLELPTDGGLDLLFPSWTITGLYTVAMFVVGDLSRLILHRWMHRSPRLWKVHQVHHSATSMNPLTVYRVHPIESFLFGLRGVLAGGLVTGVFIWLFGNQLSGWDILGVNILGMLFNAFALGTEEQYSSDVLEQFFYFSSGPTMIAGILLAMRLISEERGRGTESLRRCRI